MMKYVLTLFLLASSSPLWASDSLMDALMQGKFSGEIDAAYSSGSDEEGNQFSGKQKIYLEYTLPPIKGIDFTFATQTLSQSENNIHNVNKIRFGEARYHSRADSFAYRLSANYYSTLLSPNEDTQTITSQAFGLKAEIDLENFEAYIALSRVADSDFELSSAPSLQGRDKLLPTASLLLSNNDAPNTRAAALNVKYALHKNVALGSRYTVADDLKSLNTFNGIYTSFGLSEVAKGLNVTVAFDQEQKGGDERQWSVQFKNNF
jgi:hypothetical protein